MISLKNINNKSFNNFSYQEKEREKIKQINIFFGKNGSGKSALSEFLQQTYPDSNGIRFFNTKYVDDEIKTKNTIKGSNLIIGSEQINLSESIQQTNNIIKNLNNYNNEYTEKIKKEKTYLYNKMNLIIKDIKNNFKTTKVHQKANACNHPEKVIELWKSDANSNDNETTTYSSSEDLDKELNIIKVRKKSLTPILTNFNKNRRIAFIEQMKKIVLVPESDITAKVVEWLKQGLDLHNLNNQNNHIEHMKCLFCESTFVSSDIKEKIDKKINSDYAKLIAAIEKLKSEMKISLEYINKMSTEPNANLDNARNSIKKLIVYLNEKELSPDKSLDISTNYFSEIDALNNLITKKIENLNQKEAKIITEQANIEKIVKIKIGTIIKNDKDIEAHLNTLKKQEKIFHEQEYSLKKSNTYLDKLKSKTNDLRGFMDMVNQTLYSLGLGFRLVFSKENDNSFDVELNSQNNNEITFQTLSEGEIRLIAFIKFYFSLFSEYKNATSKRKYIHKFNTSVKLIILDDPITSIDSNNRYFMTTIINKLLKESINTKIDTVILTHSIFDFHNFAYNMPNQVSHFKIIKNNKNESEIKFIEKNQLKNYSDDYRATFYEIVRFCYLNSRELPLLDQYIRFGNKCRFILETHARTNYNIEYVTNTSISDIMDCYNVDESNRESISQMLDIINSLSHGISYTWDYISGISANEIQKAARTMLKMMYQKDKQHVSAMTSKSISELNTAINNWNLN